MADASQAAGHTDIDRGHWSLRLLPAALRPYGRLARWDRPIGIWLLLFPAWWSVTLASSLSTGAEALRWVAMMVAFAVGAIAMRGAGCTWNDIIDRDIDAKVERTRGRPLPSADVTVRQATRWMVLQAALGALVLASFNLFAILVGLASLLLVAIYPLMKRVTFWPQFVLGLTFNWGALLGWAAVRGDLAAPAIALYAAGVAWTLVYDTIYAMQDQRDDSIIGVRSTARRFSQHPTAWLSLFAVVSVVLLTVAGAFAKAGWPYYAGVGAVALHLAWQIVTVRRDVPADCLAKFKANRHIGWLLLGGILAAQAG